MTPSELANKIAEEVFRTIERENGIVKAEVAAGIERALAKELPAFLQSRGKTWGLWSDYGLVVPMPGEAVYYDAKGMPYFLCGGEFRDPDGKKVIPPPDVVEKYHGAARVQIQFQGVSYETWRKVYQGGQGPGWVPPKT